MVALYEERASSRSAHYLEHVTRGCRTAVTWSPLARPGIMEAANRGAFGPGGKTIGLNIRLPFEQGPKSHITKGLHFEFHYFFNAEVLVRLSGEGAGDSSRAASGRSTRCF